MNDYENFKLEDKILYPEKKQLIMMLSISLILTAGGILMIDESEVLGYTCTLFFSTGMIVFIIQLLPGSSYLKLSKTGLEYSSLFRRHSVNWEDIQEFRIMNQKQSGLTVNKFIGWNYYKTVHDKDFSKKLSKSLRNRSWTTKYIRT